jgi:radical SAM protein with 4Fe4S-binding SPASM domain
MSIAGLERPIRTPSAEEVSACVPVAVVWEITLSCNLKCAHCGSRAGAPRADELTTSEALALIQDLASMGVRDIGLIGGEAYLRRDWIELIGAIKREGMNCALQTGGRALSESKIAAAAAAGLDSAGVSLDGMAPNHDRVRGVPGSFRQAVAALRNLRTHGVTTTVNTQLWTGSIADLDDLLDVIADEGVGTWQVQLTVAMGAAADHPELILQPYQVLEIMPKLAELYDEAQRRGVRMVLGNNVGYFGPFEAKMRSVEDVADHWGGCSAGQNALGIEADGKIKGCPSLATEDYVAGNVRTQTVKEIWANSQRMAFNRHPNPDDLWGFCRSCYYGPVCRGGCTWTAHSLFGRPGNNPYCHHRALTLQKDGLRERVRQVRKAPGVPFDNGLFELIVEDAQGRCVRIEHPPEAHPPGPTEPGAPVREQAALLLCAGCEAFVLPHEERCPFCGGEVLETHGQRREQASSLGPLVDELRMALAR